MTVDITTFLIFDDACMGLIRTEDVLLCEIVEEGVHFHDENTVLQFWSIAWRQIGPQLAQSFLDLVPLIVGG